MIKLDNVSKSYNQTRVIDCVSLEILKGELFVIIGPSGSGKTTLLKMINKMIKPTTGKIYIDGADISSIKGELLRRRIGYVIQDIGLLPHMNVKENVSIVPKLLKMDKKKIEENVVRILDMVGLDPSIYLNKYPSQLSGGQAQRVGIARALAADAQVLLMDEPFGALDPITKSHLQNQISRIHKKLNKTIVFVTHDIDEAIKIASRIAVIKDGRLVQVDTPQNILSKPKNEFIVSFLGSDRALKKLSRLYVKDFMRKADRINLTGKDFGYLIDAVAKNYIWITNENDILKGWADLSDSDQDNQRQVSYIEIDHKTFAAGEDETLKDTVSKMLWHSSKVLPVCKEDGKLIGEIDLSDIITKT